MLFYISLGVNIALVILLLYILGNKPVEAFIGSSEYDDRQTWEMKKQKNLIFGVSK